MEVPREGCGGRAVQRATAPGDSTLGTRLERLCDARGPQEGWLHAGVMARLRSHGLNILIKITTTRCVCVCAQALPVCVAFAQTLEVGHGRPGWDLHTAENGEGLLKSALFFRHRCPQDLTFLMDSDHALGCGGSAAAR